MIATDRWLSDHARTISEMEEWGAVIGIRRPAQQDRWPSG
jgi:hypothetical protein